MRYRGVKSIGTSCNCEIGKLAYKLEGDVFER